MKHIRKFESHKNFRKRQEIIKESVLQVDDVYKVRTMIDIPQSFINSVVKKVKDNAGKNLKQFFGDVDIAEEIVKYVSLNFMNVDKIPSNFLVGGTAQTQTQAQTQTETQTETQGETQAQVQVQTDGQAQAQPEAQTQAQPEAQPQAQPEAQSEEEFEEVAEEEKEEEEKEEEEKEEEKGEEELPA